jgi:DNA-binding response OmpR family regulator
VEDEEMLRTMMMMLLESKGYRVLTASDGEEGIELYQQRRHDIQLVLSDYGLPKLNGAELFRRVRALDPHARVILASGFYEPQLRADLVREGIAQLLSKPYRAATVLNAIRTVLDSTESAHGQE